MQVEERSGMKPSRGGEDALSRPQRFRETANDVRVDFRSGGMIGQPRMRRDSRLAFPQTPQALVV